MGGESEGDGAGIGAKGTYGSSPAPADSAQWFLEDDSRVAITGRGDAPKRNSPMMLSRM
jgi:hypothetical protein